ncbi:protein obstructor-E-like [Arctopsyche grandis]|uniref:protein obstructor-E-like n=1 Tax=Arctopsyche grandis TaxID=121162 RepID=UPI00406D70F0
MLRQVFLTALVGLVCVVYGQRYNQLNSPSPGLQNYGGQQQQAASRGSSAGCQEKNARYPVSGQCDAYVECRDGVGEEKMCPDGLFFNPNSSVFSYPCVYPIDVDCAGRAATQSANPSDDCPHQYGYFRKSAVPSECGQFVNCVEGRGYIFDCPEGLAFSSDTYRCDWPDMVPDCDAEAFLGFSCPPEPVDPFFGAQEFRNYRSPEDCQRFFTCVNNKPRLYNCGEGNAYNDLIQACDGIENVTSCASQYQRSQTGVQLQQLQYQPNQQVNQPGRSRY